MTTVDLEEKLRKEYPDMFSHPELNEGEIFLGTMIVDVAEANIQVYQRFGLKSARLGNSFLKKKDGYDFTYYPIFANLQQYLGLEIAHQQKEEIKR